MKLVIIGGEKYLYLFIYLKNKTKCFKLWKYKVK